jgi:hypothetical protein
MRRGRLELRVGDAQGLDADLRDLDLIYGVDVWQFWSDQPATVRDLAMVSWSRRAGPPAPRGSAAREGWLYGAQRAGS